MTIATQGQNVAVQVADANGVRDVRLSLCADVTVGEVLAKLGLCASSTLLDGEAVASNIEVPATSVLSEGARLSTPSNAERGVEVASCLVDAPARLEVAVVGGLDAGHRTELAPGTHLVATTSGEDHEPVWLQVDPLAEPGGQVAGPWHMHGGSVHAVEVANQVLAVGKVIDPESSIQAQPRQATVNRPPRVVTAQSPTPIAVPVPPPPVNPPPPLSWATLLAPIPIAFVMAFFFRPLFAIFAAMGPLVALGRWYEGRRRFKKAQRSRSLRVQSQTADLEQQRRTQSIEATKLRWLANPHVAELWQRARSRSVRLWERRPQSAGYLQVTIGLASDTVPVEFDANGSQGAKLRTDVYPGLDEPLELGMVPCSLDLAAAAGFGIHGVRQESLAVIRSIVLQLATLHGPADLAVGLLCAKPASSTWDWLKWLPHVDLDLVAHESTEIARTFRTRSHAVGDAWGPSRASAAGPSRTYVIVVDDVAADVAAVRTAALEAGVQLRVVAIAPSPTQLPAMCDDLIQVSGAEVAVVSASSTLPSHLFAVGVGEATAVGWARALAACCDPELVDDGSQLEQAVSLLGLLGSARPHAIAAAWEQRSPAQPPAAVIGMGIHDKVSIDLTTDGPHALIAGTTGSGKSELLRTMVVSLAHSCPPEHLNFVLVDFKGGGAFDRCADLPHVAGLLTDLDEAIVGRAIQSLQSELQRREMLFRSLRVSSYEDAVVAADEPLARLVIVIDEFATLASEYHDLLASIVDLAARGRSLGMHLVLATQRPSGVVDQKIRANTNLRIALRVQDAADSQDIVGSSRAAAISRTTPGRAVFRVSGEQTTSVQTAFTGAPATSNERCEVYPWTLFSRDDEGAARCPGSATSLGGSDLDVLVAAVQAANEQRGGSARPLWADPLPSSLDWIDLGARELGGDADATAAAARRGLSTCGVTLGLADLPESQTHVPWRWDMDAGALAVFGASASCTSKVVAAALAALVSANSAADLHVYLLTAGVAVDTATVQLPHVGAVVQVSEQERIERTLRYVESQLAGRVSAGWVDGPRIVLMIDNLAGVFNGFGDVAELAAVDRLAAIARDGAALGVHLLVTARTARDITHRLGQQIPHRLTLELADPGGYLTLGLTHRDMVELNTMRAIDVATRSLVQLVEPPELDSQVDNTCIDEVFWAPSIRAMPSILRLHELPTPSRREDGALVLPIGLSTNDLAVAELRLDPGEHVLVLSPRGIGRSAMLAVLATQLAHLQVCVARVEPTGPVSCSAEVPIRRIATVHDVAELAAELEAQSSAQEHTVVVVDDAHLLDEPLANALRELTESRIPNLALIVGSTPEHARSVRSWTQAVRASGTGVLLGTASTDADLFKVRLPRPNAPMPPGRGFLVSRGVAHEVQFACAEAGPGNAD